MERADFNENSPGKFVKNLDGILSYVPDPLPPQLQWSNQLAQSIAMSSAALGRLCGLAEKLPDSLRLVRMFLRREAEMSSRIERTYAGVRTMLLFDNIPDVAEQVPAVVEVNNNYKALLHGFEAVRNRPITSGLIRDLNAVLLKDVAGPELTPGAYRNRPVWIGTNNDIRQARFVPPPPMMVSECMEELIRYIGTPDQLPPIVRAAITHYQFECIHPFADGNGRIGRVLVLLMLKLENAVTAPLLNPSAELERRRTEYYQHLMKVSTNGSWTDWIVFFCDAVRTEASRACDIVQQLHDLQTKYHKVLHRARTSALLMKLVDEVFAEPAITLKRCTQLLKITPGASQRLLDKLVAEKILEEVTNQRRNRVYLATEVLNVFNSDGKRNPTRPRSTPRRSPQHEETQE